MLLLSANREKPGTQSPYTCFSIEMNLSEAARAIEQFEQRDAGRRLAALEVRFRGCRRETARELCLASEIGLQLLGAAFALKRAAGQINVLIHGLGILAALPHILAEAEVVEDLSLGAGNTGRPFDLETSQRVAEFKFIQWRGRADTIRENSLFKDFYSLAEADTGKQKSIYLLELDRPLKFLNGRRALDSVLKEHAIRTSFVERYQRRFTVVREYYEFRRATVTLVDLTEILPGLRALVSGLDADASE